MKLKPIDKALLDYAKSGDLELIKYLIGKGANIKAKDEDGFTAKTLASYNGHSAIVEYFENLKTKTGENNHDINRIRF